MRWPTPVAYLCRSAARIRPPRGSRRPCRRARPVPAWAARPRPSLAHDAVHVNAIAPGPIETELIEPITEEFRREKTVIFALRRLGLPDKVAPTAVFLASDDSNFYAGQTLCPNGGDIMV